MHPEVRCLGADLGQHLDVGLQGRGDFRLDVLGLHAQRLQPLADDDRVRHAVEGKAQDIPRPKRRSNVLTIARRPAPAVEINVPSMSQSRTVGRGLAVTVTR